MSDTFFSKKWCDRCGTSLEGKGRIMSMYNTDCICMACKNAETKRPDYKMAQDAEISQIKAGNFNFLGIGYAR